MVTNHNDKYPIDCLKELQQDCSITPSMITTLRVSIIMEKEHPEMIQFGKFVEVPTFNDVLIF